MFQTLIDTVTSDFFLYSKFINAGMDISQEEVHGCRINLESCTELQVFLSPILWSHSWNKEAKKWLHSAKPVETGYRSPKLVLS